MQRPPHAQVTGISFPAYSETLTCEPGSAGLARRLVSCAFEGWGLDWLVGAATQCVSELVANSVTQSDARLIRVTVFHPRGGRVCVQVTGEGHADRNHGVREPDEVYVHRMTVINALADGWGVEHLAWGLRVWCEFDPGFAKKHEGRSRRAPWRAGRSRRGAAC